MLVRDLDTNQIKLAAIFIDPWKCIVKEEVFNVPENVFFAKNCDIIMPVGKDCTNMYSHDKMCTKGFSIIVNQNVGSDLKSCIDDPYRDA